MSRVWWFCEEAKPAAPCAVAARSRLLLGRELRSWAMGCGASSSKYQVADEPKPTSAWAAYVRQDTSHEELLQRVQAHTEAESESTKAKG